MGMVSVTEAKGVLNIPTATTTYDAELQDIIDALTAVAEDLCGVIVQRTGIVEYHDGGRPAIVLRQRPVLQVTVVTEYAANAAYPLTVVTNPSQATAYSVMLEQETGELVRMNSAGFPYQFPYGVDNILVTYDAGFASTPPHLKRGALEILRNYWQGTQQGGRPAFNGSGNGDAPVRAFAGYLTPNMAMEFFKPSLRTPGIG